METSAKNEASEFVVEDAFKRLEEITIALDNPTVGLRESLKLYSEGVRLVCACKESLEGVEKEIMILDEL